MAKVRVNPNDVVRLGPDIARLKASTPKKRWRKLVKYAHKRGFTVAGQLSGAPDPLKERTRSSLRKQAERTVASAYKPVMQELDQRETALKYFNEKQAADEAAYQTWLMGETNKIDAQARAADATLAAQQGEIARDLNTAQTAAKADSARRMMATAGNVSNPAESTALDQSAADQRSREMVANARTHSAELRQVGDSVAATSRAALISQQAARSAARAASVLKSQSDITGERKKAVAQQAADSVALFGELQAAEAEKAQSNREFGLAADELGYKQADLAAEVQQANKKFRLEQRKFNLDRWKAKNADTVAKAKVQLGYDQIASRDGQQKADEALRKWIERYRARNKNDGKDKAGPDKEQRTTYRAVETVRGYIQQWHANGRVKPANIRARLRKMGYDDVTIDVANDLWRNSGELSAEGRAKAKRLGINRPGQFW